jgi:phosphotransacetylase
MIATLAQLVAHAGDTAARHIIVMWPDSAPGLRGAALARERGLGKCTLIGDVAAIRALSSQEGVDLSSLTLIDEPDTENTIRQAVHLCHQGQADVLVNDGVPLHRLLPALLDRQNGLRAEARLCGVSVLEMQAPRRLLLLADGIVNVSPDLEQHISIIHSAVHVAHRLHMDLPRVALLAATEMVNPKSPFSVDAAQITVMARRNQIKGAIVDGPLGFDNAISSRAAELKGIDSQVAGQADILVASDLETGNLLLTTLSSLCQVAVVNVIVGAKVPVVLWSPHEDAQRRLAAAALGIILS